MEMNTETILVRKGKKEDLADVLKLIRELALFEKAPEQVTNTISNMEADGFGKNPIFDFYVAELKNKIVGIAVYFTKYSTWKGKGLYLDDLFVTEAHRGKGIGKMLFDQIIVEAKNMNAKQMHWQVLDWNTPAIDLYKKYGATIDSEWLDCKFHFNN